MADKEPQGVQDRLPGESSLPIIYGPISQAEHQRQEERQAKDTYKNRQLSLTESNVRFTRTIAFFTVISAAASTYQGFVGKKNSDAAQGALKATVEQFRSAIALTFL